MVTPISKDAQENPEAYLVHAPHANHMAGAGYQLPHCQQAKGDPWPWPQTQQIEGSGTGESAHGIDLGQFDSAAHRAFLKSLGS